MAPYVSRGGSKLDGALRDLRVPVAGRRWIDAGASTGGFTDRLLQGGAAGVIAVDVGYGQLDWALRNDQRVVVLERTNIRNLSADDLPWKPEAAVADLSFISLTQVIPVLVELCESDADLVILVKPQFEVGREALSKGGVVRDPELWRQSMRKVADAGASAGLGVVGASLSDLKGPAGNREFFLHLKSGHDSDMDAIDRAVGQVR